MGSNNEGYEEVMGTYGIGEINENGKMFADLCSFNRLIIGGSAEVATNFERWEPAGLPT